MFIRLTIRRQLTHIAARLAIGDPVLPVDIVLVLAGLPERKTYGLDLLEAGVTRNVVLSVGRFEIRKFAASEHGEPAMIDCAHRLAPAQRHLFVEVTTAGSAWSPANIAPGTFPELCALADRLSTSLRTVAIVTTSIHMRRVRMCCHRIAGFRKFDLRFYPVPEPCSSFRQAEWWRSLPGRKYVASEWLKLAWYSIRYWRCE